MSCTQLFSGVLSNTQDILKVNLIVFFPRVVEEQFNLIAYPSGQPYYPSDQVKTPLNVMKQPRLIPVKS